MTSTADIYTSPVSKIVNNGIAIFESLHELDDFATPYTLSMTLLVVCVAGEVSGVIDLTQRHMHAGELMVLRHGHHIDALKQSNDFDGFYILVDDHRLDSMLPMSSYMAPCLSFFRDNPIVNVDSPTLHTITMLHSLLKSKNQVIDGLPFNRAVVNALCEALFYETLGIYTAMMNRRAHAPSRREEVLSRFIALVEENFHRERSVNFYARKLCLSAKHLSSVVKSASGLTAGEWIDHKVIIEAKMLLRNTGMTVQEISASLNFANQSFFGKYFKHLTGMSPRAYRSNPSSSSVQ